jgi:hypothetical protein
MKAGHLAAIAVALLCTGCAGGAVGLAVVALGGATMGSMAVTGKGPIDETMSVASGQDCRILDGLSRPDRGICEPTPVVAVASNAAPAPQAPALQVKVESKVEPAPSVAVAALRPEASLLSDHCAIATVPPTPCRETGASVQVASAGRTTAPRAAEAVRKEPEAPVRVASREPSKQTKSAARREPARAVASNDKKPAGPARESVAWVADESVMVGLGPDGSTEAFRKQLHAAIERWQQAQAQ